MLLSKKLNLGCGTDIRKGYLNVDKYNYEGVDYTFDLNLLHWPFNSNRFEEVICQDIIEHLTYIPEVMKELARITANKGKVKIRVPHFLYANSYVDPTHKHLFSWRYFHSFVKGNREQDSLYNFRDFSSIKVTIEFEKSLFMPWNYLIDLFVNHSDLGRDLYERTPLRIFPCKNLIVELEK